MPSLLERIDAVCEEFEERWGSTPPTPRLEDFVAGWEGLDRTELLRHLVPIDLHYRRRAGETPELATYIARFPEAQLGLAADEIGPYAAGVRFGDYLIERELGRGGMGVVYAARQLALDRRVALKILPTAHALSAEAVRRFEREAQAAGRLHHPNIVPVFEVGQLDNSSYIAMQLIEGVSLDQLRRELEGAEESSTDEMGGRPSFESSERDGAAESRLARQWRLDRPAFRRTIARLGVQVADALAFAHAQGVVHRDIKPSNLLLADDGRLWVADFGLAMVADSDLTMTGDIIGTLRYMSPERLEGRCDERADVYGLGATLYELLSGRRIHAGSRRTALIESIERVEPAALRSLDPSTPLDLDTIVQRAIEKEPERRYASANELADDLRRFLEDRPILARRVGLGERLLRWRRQNKAVASLLASVLALLIVLIVAAVVAAAVYQRQSQENLELAQKEGRARQAADAAALESRRTLYFAQMLLASRAANEAGGIAALRSFVAPWAEPAADLPEVRGWEWYYLNGVAHQEEAIYPVEPYALGLDWHPSMPWIAIASTPVQVVDRRDGTSIVELEAAPAAVFSVRFSPDGSRLAAAANGVALVWSTDDWSVVGRLPLDDMGALVAWHPDGERLAVQCFHDAFVRLWNYREDTIVASSEGKQTLGLDVTRAHYSAGGEWLALDGGYGRITVLDGETLDQVSESRGAHGVIYSTAISAGGVLATGAVDPVIRLWDPRSGHPIGELVGHAFRVTSLAWHEQWLASSSWDSTIRVWEPAAGREVRVLKGHTRNLREAVWSPDGRRLASVADDGTLRIWPLEGPAPQHTVAGGSTVLNELAVEWTKSGTLVTNLGGFGRLRDAAGRWSEQRPCVQLALSPDGRLRATRGEERVVVELVGEDRTLVDVPAVMAGENHLAFSPSGTRLVVAEPGQLVLIDVERAVVTRIPAGTIRAIEWSADESRIAIADYEGVIVLDVQGQETSRRQYGSGVHDLAWGPSGRRLALACVDQSVKIVNADSLEPEVKLLGHTNTVRGVSWSPDGNRLASCSEDGSVHLWDVREAALAATLAIEQPGYGIDWSPDGSALVCVDEFGRLYFWDATPGGFDARER